MDRSFYSGAIGTPPSAPASPSIGYPQPGDALIATPPTKPGHYWYYMITEELRKLITKAGLTPSASNVNQVAAALDELYGKVYVDSVDLASAIAVSSNVQTNVVSRLLPAGLWETSGNILFHCSAGTPAYAGLCSSVSTTSATADGFSTHRENVLSASITFDQGKPIPTTIFDLSVPTTIYLSGSITIVTGTWKIYGYLNSKLIKKY